MSRNDCGHEQQLGIGVGRQLEPRDAAAALHAVPGLVEDNKAGLLEANRNCDLANRSGESESGVRFVYVTC